MESERDKWFVVCVRLDLITLVIDILASVVFEIPVGNVLFHLAETSYFAIILYTIAAWFYYVIEVIYEDKPGTARKLKNYSIIPYILYVLFVVANIWTGWLYRLSPEGVYSRGPLFAVPVGMFAVYAVAILGFSIVEGRKIRLKKLRWILILLPLIVTVGIVAQLSIPGWLTIFPSYTVALFMAYIYIQNRNTQIVMTRLTETASRDALTGLYNRNYIEKSIIEYATYGKNQIFAILIIDLDDLKQINDTYGHECGDEAIKQTAALLTGFFRSSDIVARYGGDEFLVFVKDLDNPDKLKDRMNDLVESFRSRAIPEYGELELHCSIGAEIGVARKDEYASVLKRADAALYHVKRNGKNNFAFYSNDMPLGDYRFVRVDAESVVAQYTDIDADSFKDLLDVIGAHLPVVLLLNLSSYSYYTMENVLEQAKGLPASGSCEDLFAWVKKDIHPDDRPLFERAFTVERLLLAHAAHDRGVSRMYRLAGARGEYKWFILSVVFRYNNSKGSIEAFAFARASSEVMNRRIDGAN